MVCKTELEKGVIKTVFCPIKLSYLLNILFASSLYKHLFVCQNE